MAKQAQAAAASQVAVRNNIVTFIVARPSDSYNIETGLLYFFQATAPPPHCIAGWYSSIRLCIFQPSPTTTINWPKSSSFSLKKG
jgi:hypothetical protein